MHKLAARHSATVKSGHCRSSTCKTQVTARTRQRSETVHAAAWDSGLSSADDSDASIASARQAKMQEIASAKQSRPILNSINEATKWVVSAVVFATLLLKHDMAMAWCVTGSIASSFICKALKYVINEQRPANAGKADPGMPSSHANSLSYLSVYGALGVVSMSALDMLAKKAAVAALLASGIFLTWLRVALGYHTVAQVVVGFLLGSVGAVAWAHLGNQYALALIAGNSIAVACLYTLTGFAVLLFAYKNVKSWFKHTKRA